MSNKALNWAFESEIGNVGAKFVLVALADHAGDYNGEDWVCFPSTERLMAFTSQGERTILRHLAWLEETGWITRRKRIRRKREESIYEYTLHRARADAAPAAPAPEACAPPANMTGGRAGGPPANLAPTSCQIGNDHLPNWQHPPHPPIELNPQGTPSEPARARADSETPGGVAGGVIDREWERLKAGWAKVSPGRLAPKPGRRAFERAAAAMAPERITDAGLRYLALDPDVAKFGAMRLHVWLDERRYEPWLTAGDGGGEGARRAAGWAGPPEIRAAVAAAKGEAWAVSYLDPSGWDGEAVLARTGVALRELEQAAAGLGEAAFKVGRA